MIILQAALGIGLLLIPIAFGGLVFLTVVSLIVYAILTRKGTEGMDKSAKKQMVRKSILIALAIMGVLFVLMLILLDSALRYS